MTTVTVNVEDLRSVASGLSATATSVEMIYSQETAAARSLELSTSSLAQVPGYVQDLRDESSFLTAKVDWIVLINSNKAGGPPATGDVTVEFPGAEPATMDEMETALGEQLAELGSQMGASEYHEDDPRVEMLHTYLGTWGTNADVMGAMYTALGADGTLAMTDAVGQHVGLNYSVDEQTSQTAQTTLERIRSSLHLASNAWDAATANAFGQQLVESARNPDPESEYYRMTMRTEALNWLMMDAGTASDDLVLGAAEKLDEMQQASPGQPVSWTWGGPSVFLPVMADLMAQPWALDTPSVIMRALGDTPRAALEFFDSDLGRVTYWGGEHDFSPHGDLSAVASALDVASTDPGNRSRDPQAAATIAAYAIDAITSRENFGPARDQVGTEAALPLQNILTTYFGSTASTYAADQGEHTRPTDDSDKDGHPDLLFGATAIPDDNAYHPWFDSADLDKALGVIGQDGQAMLNLRRTFNEAQGGRLPPGSTQDQFERMTSNWARVEGSMANAIGTGGINHDEVEDRYAMAWIELANKPASELAGLASSFAPPGLGKAAGWGSGAMVDWLRNQAVETWASSAKEERVKQEDLADQAYTQFAIRMLLAADGAGLNGYQDPQTGSPIDPSEYPAEMFRQNPDGSWRLLSLEEYKNLDAQARGSVDANLLDMVVSEHGITPDVDLKSIFDTQFGKRY